MAWYLIKHIDNFTFTFTHLHIQVGFQVFLVCYVISIEINFSMY